MACLPLLEPQEFLGVAVLLGVKLVEMNTSTAATGKDDEGGEDVGSGDTPSDIKDAEVLLVEVVEKFAALPKNKQRELLKVLRPLRKRR